MGLPVDLHIETVRRKTFDGGFAVKFLDVDVLAATGFYYEPKITYDGVTCHFCKTTISQWKIGDHEIGEHKRWSPGCRLLQGQLTNNVPIDPKMLKKLLPKNNYGYDVCG